jgi:hypothetical protein
LIIFAREKRSREYHVEKVYEAGRVEGTRLAPHISTRELRGPTSLPVTPANSVADARRQVEVTSPL